MSLSMERHYRLPFNPWIAQVFETYLTTHSEDEIRANNPNIIDDQEWTWEALCADEALLNEMHQHPVLQTLRTRMKLSDKTKEILYWCGVDMLADLVQLTEENLEYISAKKGLDIEEVKAYLLNVGYPPMHSPEEFLSRVPSLRVWKNESGMWDAPSFHSIQFEKVRPASYPEWIDFFYRAQEWYDELSRYSYVTPLERFTNEDILCEQVVTRTSSRAPGGFIPQEAKEFLHLAENLFDFYPENNQPDHLPEDFHCMFYALEKLFDAYGKLCVKYDVPHVVSKPSVPTDASQLKSFVGNEFIRMKKEAFTALITVLESTDLLIRIKDSWYLQGDAECRLDVAASEDGDKDFQDLLAYYAIFKWASDIVFGNLWEFAEPSCDTTLNPWLQAHVAEYRKKHPEVQDEHDLEIKALREAINVDSFLMTLRWDMGFPERLEAILTEKRILRLCDILQMTVDEMDRLLWPYRESATPIHQYLAEHGYALIDQPGRFNTVQLPEDVEGFDRNNQALKETEIEWYKSLFCHGKLVESYIPHAKRTYEEILRSIDNTNCSLENKFRALHFYESTISYIENKSPEELANVIRLLKKMLMLESIIYVKEWDRSMADMSRLADYYKEAGEYQNAINCLLEEVRIRQIHDEYPQNESIGWNYWKLGEIYDALKDEQQALYYKRLAVKMNVRLLHAHPEFDE